jgi:hypothetical protein
MKKLILSVLFCSLFFTQFDVAEASSLRLFAEQWKNWIRERAPEKKTTRLTTIRTRRASKPATVAEQTKTKLFNTTKTTTGVRQRYIIEDSSAYLSRSELNVVVTPVEPDKSILKIDNEKHLVFRISAQNNNNLRSTQAPETLYLTRLKFQIFNNTGIASDPTKFSLVVNEKDFDFDKDGTALVDFINERITANNPSEINVSFKVKDPEDTPNVDGALRFRIIGVEGVREGLFDEVRTRISGKSISQYHSFKPIAVSSGKEKISGSSINIWGKTLVAGSEDYVLNLNFGANFDDLSLEQITLSDTLSNGKVDSLISKVTAVNGTTGEILGTTRFTNSQARFKFLPAIKINRGDNFKLAFKVRIAENVNQNAEFKLDVLPSDVRVRSLSSGRDLGSSSKYFSFNSDTFSIAQSVFKVGASAQQPENFAASGNGLERTYRFFMTNPGKKEISLARISMNVDLGGLAFAGSRVASRFDLREIRDNQESSASAFTPTVVDSRKVVFNANSEFLVSRNSTTEFILKLQLVDLGGDSKNDYVAVQILDDSTLNTGSLANVRASGANFIWSDHSSSPHSTSTTDWISGYLVPGLPTGVIINKRK